MRRNIFAIAVTTVLLSAVALVLAQGPNTQRSGPGRQDFGRSGPAARSGQYGLISALPYEELSLEEENALNWMWEEEKLARDVYLALY